jgi:hypothetical protein
MGTGGSAEHDPGSERSAKRDREEDKWGQQVNVVYERGA